jgi:hypothetical protein
VRRAAPAGTAAGASPAGTLASLGALRRGGRLVLLPDLSPIPVTSSSLGRLPDALRQAEGRGAPLVVVTP